MNINKPVILCVDDERFVLDSINKQLQRHFKDLYEYEFAESAEEALEIIAELVQKGNNIIMVITDQIMPGMCGDELLAKIYQLYPSFVTILLTGQASIDSAINAINNANLYRYITKPWEENDLLLTIEQGIQKHHLSELTAKQLKQFSKFVPNQFLEQLSKKNMLDIQLGDSIKKEMTILFSDIHAFTTMAEFLPPEDCYLMINSYLQSVEPAISQNLGFIDKYIGDAVMALFEKPENGLAAAINMQQQLVTYNKNRMHLPPIEVSIGLHTGEVMLGIVGVPERLQGTVIADTVNLTSRIQGLTLLYGSAVIVSQDLISKLSNKEQYTFRFLGKFKLKGKNKEVSVYDVLDAENENVKALRLKTYADFQSGLELYFQRKFAEAAVKFYAVHEVDLEDKAAIYYLKKVSTYLCQQVPEDWNGCEIIETK